jgi:hypothetical protein
VIAIARYALVDYLRSQRFLPPLVTFLGVLAVLYAFPGGVLSGYSASAAALLPVSVWLALSLHNAEDPVQATITLVNAASRRRVVAGKTGAAAVGILTLTAVALVWPMVSDWRWFTAAELADGLLAHLTCAPTGIALGTCCICPLIKRQGYAFATGLLLSFVALFAHRLTPANLTVRLLSTASAPPSLGELTLLTLWSAALLAVVLCAVAYAASAWVGGSRLARTAG